VLDGTEHIAAELRVTAGLRQLEQLLAWAPPDPRLWAVEKRQRARPAGLEAAGSPRRAGRAAGACAWLESRPEAWRTGIQWGALDLAGSYRSVADTMLPDATQVAGPFHVVRVAN
jgi:hypothetical protein